LGQRFGNVIKTRRALLQVTRVGVFTTPVSFDSLPGRHMPNGSRSEALRKRDLLRDTASQIPIA
jgi:hypothetical protein